MFVYECSLLRQGFEGHGRVLLRVPNCSKAEVGLSYKTPLRKENRSSYGDGVPAVAERKWGKLLGAQRQVGHYVLKLILKLKIPCFLYRGFF